MRPRDLSTLLAYTIPRSLPVLIKGAPAVGKTQIVQQAALSAHAKLIYTDCATSDQTRAEGMPWPKPESGEAIFLPFGDLGQALIAKEPTVWLFDDLGWASPAVQCSFAHLFHERRTPSGAMLPDCVAIVATTNRRNDRANVSGLLEPIKSRFATIVELEVNLEDWATWWVKRNGQAELLSFLRYRSHLLHVFEPTADLVNGPSPRTWVYASNFMGNELPPDVRLAALSGAVGPGAASEFEGFLRVYADLQPFSEMIADPERAKIPPVGNPSARCAVATGLAAMADVKTLKPILRIALRLYEEAEGGEYAALIMRDIFHRDTAQVLTRTKDWLEMTFGPLGHLISGQDFEPSPAPISRKGRK